jgi:hypothetical protein
MVFCRFTCDFAHGFTYGFARGFSRSFTRSFTYVNLNNYNNVKTPNNKKINFFYKYIYINLYKCVGMHLYH